MLKIQKCKNILLRVGFDNATLNNLTFLNNRRIWWDSRYLKQKSKGTTLNYQKNILQSHKTERLQYIEVYFPFSINLLKTAVNNLKSMASKSIEWNLVDESTKWN